ncbi:MAG: transglutaminase-like domain-containing protein [Acidimicrobiia bacterium]|nr:transglutaminase-like domain-containing protein [Acidimicrobiia bacterium]
MGQARFRELLADETAQPPLDEVSLAISSALRPGLDTTECLATMEMLAAECPWPDPPRTGPPSPEDVAEYLFGHHGFTGNQDAYYDWRNSCLDRVLATETGIPISLSILMIEIGRRVDVELVGVGMPSHFLVGVAGDPNRFFDPFNGGRRLDRGAARALFDELTGGRIPWRESHLQPTPNRAIAIRVLNNLKAIFSQQPDRVRYGIIMQLRGSIAELRTAEADAIVEATAIFN